MAISSILICAESENEFQACTKEEEYVNCDGEKGCGMAVVGGCEVIQMDEGDHLICFNKLSWRGLQLRLPVTD